MPWERLAPLAPQDAGLRSGCLICGPQPILLPGDAVIAVGFGDAGVTMDGDPVWSEAAAGDVDFDEYWTCQRAETAAADNPDHDWRIYFHGPLGDAEYQRHGDGQWVLVRKGLGFA